MVSILTSFPDGQMHRQSVSVTFSVNRDSFNLICLGGNIIVTDPILKQVERFLGSFNCSTAWMGPCALAFFLMCIILAPPHASTPCSSQAAVSPPWQDAGMEKTFGLFSDLCFSVVMWRGQGDPSSSVTMSGPSWASPDPFTPCE